MMRDSHEINASHETSQEAIQPVTVVVYNHINQDGYFGLVNHKNPVLLNQEM